jgi:hypothetical protein
VFGQMFHGPLAQTTQEETIQVEDKHLEVIRVPDITIEALNCVLTYIYAEEVELTMNSVFDVLYAGLVNKKKQCSQNEFSEKISS